MKKTISMLLIIFLVCVNFSMVLGEINWIAVEDNSGDISYSENSGWGPWSGDANDSGASVMVSNNVPGSSATFTFYGTHIQYISRKHPLIGVVEIFIDDISQGEFDTYANSWGTYKQVIFQKTDMPADNHTIKVVLKGASSEDSNGSRLMIDCFKYALVDTMEDIALAEMSVDDFTLSPSFKWNTTEYNADVLENTEKLKVNFTLLNSDKTKILINNEEITENSYVFLSITNESQLVIQAVDKLNEQRMLTYIIKVNKPKELYLDDITVLGNWQMNPKFSRDVLNYEAGGNYDSSITLVPKISESEFIININGENVYNGQPKNIPLNKGENIINIGIKDGNYVVGGANLAARWNFERNSQDGGKNANHATVSGNVTYVQGKSGMAANLGSGAFLTVKNSNSMMPKNQITICGWIKPESADKGQDIVFKDQTYRLRIDTTNGIGRLQGCVGVVDNQGNLAWYSDNSYIESADDTVKAGIWQHVAMTYDNKEVVLYLNGTQVAKTSNSKYRDFNNTENSISIGSDFIGLLDDIRIYDTALDEKSLIKIANDTERRKDYTVKVNNDINNINAEGAIKAVEESTPDTLNSVLFGQYKHIYELLNIRIEDASKISDNKSFHEILMSKKPFASGEDLASKFNNCLFVNEFNNANTEELKNLLKSDDLNLEINDSCIDIVAEKMNDILYTSIEDIIKDYYCFAAEINIKNAAVYQQFRQVVEKTAVKLDMIIKGAGEDILAKAYKNVFEKIKENAYNTFIDMLNAVNSEIKILIDNSNLPPAGGSGGGNSGGSGGGYSVPVREETEKKPLLRVPPIIREQKQFRDIKNDYWAKDSIDNLYQRGILEGVNDSSFLPDGNLKREEFAKIAVLAFNLPLSEEKSSFVDVDENEWYSPYVATLEILGFSKGVDNKKFGVGENITRQDIAVMLCSIIESKNIELKNEVSLFADKDEIADYAMQSVNKMNVSGIIKGVSDSKFAPMQFVTRAQTAAMIDRIFQFGGNI